MTDDMPPLPVPFGKSIVVTRDEEGLTITVCRQAWLAVRVIIYAAITAGTQPAGILLALMIGALLAAAGYHLLLEAGILGPLVAVALVGAVLMPLILWFGFTKTIVRIDERHLLIQHRAILTRRQVRWPTHLIGDVRKGKHAVEVLTVEGRRIATVMPFWPAEEVLIIALLREALGLPEMYQPAFERGLSHDP